MKKKEEDEDEESVAWPFTSTSFSKSSVIDLDQHPKFDDCFDVENQDDEASYNASKGCSEEEAGEKISVSSNCLDNDLRKKRRRWKRFL